MYVRTMSSVCSSSLILYEGCKMLIMCSFPNNNSFLRAQPYAVTGIKSNNIIKSIKMSKMAEFIKGCTTCQPEIDMILIQSLHNSHLIGQCITCSILSRALNDDRLQIPEDCPESSWASLYIKRPSFPLSNLHISRKMHPDREEYERVAHIEIYTPGIRIRIAFFR